MIFSKILVAYDGSELGKKALTKAIELARSNDLIEIEVLHVVTYSAVITEYGGAFAVTEMQKNMMQYGEDILKQSEAQLSAIPNKWRTILKEGPPGNIIVQHAKENHCKLIVMGCRGLSGLKELFLGSVSHHVVQHADVPVLIVK